MNIKINKKAIDSLISSNNLLVDQNDKLFLERMFSDGFEKYVKRLNELGFTGREKILDAGCGFGQWSIALSHLNKNVFSHDVSKRRIQILNEIIDYLEIENITTSIGNLENIELKESYYDGIFSYSVLYKTDWRKVIDRFSVILKREGLLYICSNGLGWYLYNILNNHNPAADYDPKSHAACSISETINSLYEGSSKTPIYDRIVPSEFVLNYLDKKFKILYHGFEGTGAYEGKSQSNSFFLGEYLGVEAVYEIIAERK